MTGVREMAWVRAIPSRALRWLAVFLVLASTVGCDQAAKHFARSQLSQAVPATLPGGFLELTLTENPGAFLSWGASLPPAVRGGLLTAGVSVGLALLLAYLLRAVSLRWPAFLGLVLLWAGGMSNLLDRFLRDGRVTDFILLRAGPLHTGVFNLADIAIIAGIAILIFSFRQSSESNPSAPTPSSQS